MTAHPSRLDVALRSLVLAVLLSFVSGCRGARSWEEIVRVSDQIGDGPRVLCVVAHPDDEIAFAGVLYKTATFLDGVCDLVTITNGEGGFKYATLAEPLYGLELTDEVVGRRHLPEIRTCLVCPVLIPSYLGEASRRAIRNPGTVTLPRDLKSPHS